jgi:hypothetical protein
LDCGYESESCRPSKNMERLIENFLEKVAQLKKALLTPENNTVHHN